MTCDSRDWEDTESLSMQGAIRWVIKDNKRWVIKDNKTLGSAEHAAGHCSVNPASATTLASGHGDSHKQSYSWGGERKPGSS